MAVVSNVKELADRLEASQVKFHEALDSFKPQSKLKALAREMFAAAFRLGQAERAEKNKTKRGELL